jgi:choice-of-anchor B domain-containing protein
MRIIVILMLAAINLQAQDSLNIQLLFHWNDTSIAQATAYGALFRYNEIWGTAINGREYAIIGSTAGTHIFDVTDPINSVQAAFIPGAHNLGLHRDYHDYNGYLYMVCDEGPSTLQIADLRFLPDSVPVVYDSDALFSRTHNIFIDSLNGLLYTTRGGIYSLADPVNPVKLSVLGPSGHDLYVRNDTLYVNHGVSGLRIYDYTDHQSPGVIGTLISYPHSGYNHSGWLSETGSIYAFADETYGTDIKICDVSDYADIQVLSYVNSGGAPDAMPHNLIFKKQFLYVSYYHDGLYIYDLSDPSNPTVAGYYDTYPQSPAPNYNGAWGVYPFLPSGNVLVSDTEYGLFVFNVNDIISGVEETAQEPFDLRIFPNPFTDAFQITYTAEGNTDVSAELYDLYGNRVLNMNEAFTDNSGEFQASVDCQILPLGVYFLSMRIGKGTVTRKVIKME